MTTAIRILHLDTPTADQRPIAAHLARLGLPIDRRVVHDQHGLKAALLEARPDLVVCQWGMDPSYGAIAALADIRMDGCATPFIILVDTIGESDLEAAFEAGITDYVQAAHLTRPPFAIRRALAEVADRHARTKAEQESRLSEERFRLLFGANLSGVAIHEMLYDAAGNPRDYRFIDLNPAFEEMLGIPRQDIVGRTVRDVFPGIEPVWIERYAAVVDAWVPTHFEEYSPTIGRHFEVMAFGLTSRQFAVVCRDITLRKQREVERAEHELMLIDALEKAKAASTAKSQFLSMMSHEIRTPLNGIIGMADMLMQTGLTDEQSAMSQIIQDCGQGLLAVIGDVLDLSAIESGRMEVAKRDFDVRRLAGEIEGVFAATARTRGLRLAVRVDTEVPARVRCDDIRIRQVLLNLVGNAVKFTEAGSVAVHIHLPPDGAHAGLIVYDVLDTGPGISEAYLQRIFEPFTQADSTSSRRHGGSGLGLAIAKRIADLLGGTLTVTSTIGSGSCFRFAVPFEAAPIDSPATPPSLRIRAPAWTRTPLVLVVEDDPTCQFTFHMMLKELGCAYALAENGLQAISAVAERSFDLVLMDCQMPECDGYTASRTIRERMQAGARHLPIVAVTANVFTEDRARCTAAGMDDFLAKPCTLETLRTALVYWLREHLAPIEASARPAT